MEKVPTGGYEKVMKTLTSVKRVVITPLFVANEPPALLSPEEAQILQPFLVISHRFGREEIGYGRGDENTIELLTHAINKGSRAVEFDVWKVNQDHGRNEFVVFHGPSLKPITNGRGRLPDVRMSYLETLKTRHGSRIPTLRQVLERMPPEMQMVNIELKGCSGGLELANFLRNLHEAGKLPFLQNILVSAFDHRTLIEFKQTWNEPKIGLLFSSIDSRMLAYAKAVGAYSLNLDDNVVEPNFVEETRAHGLKIFVWTVNDLARARYLAKLGVHGIFSDRLDLANYDFTS